MPASAPVVAPPTAGPQQSVIKWKVVMAGACFVGKTSLVDRMVKSKYAGSHTESTIGMCFFSKAVVRERDGAVVNVLMHDTAGAERYATLIKLYYRDADVVVIVYAVDDPSSMTRALALLVEMRQHMVKPDASIVLVGNKCDINPPHAVPDAEAKAVAGQHDVQCFLTSARMDYNVRQLFDHLVDIAELPTATPARTTTSAPLTSRLLSLTYLTQLVSSSMPCTIL
jgi:small GTP-binding protein